VRDIALFVRGRPRAKELLLFFPSCVRACACERVMWVGGAVWMPCGGGGASGVPVVVGDAWPSAWLSGWVL
jgi:hypothetical protein